MTRVLLLAAGEKKRWDNYLDVPKHLAPVGGEPLIHGTIRRLTEHGFDDVVVTVSGWQDCGFAVSPARAELVVGRRTEITSCRALWPKTRPVLMLYGDTYFSDALLGDMAAVRDSGDPWWWVWGRKHAGNGKWYGEMWGWWVPPAAQSTLIAADVEMQRAFRAGEIDRRLGWEMYRAMYGWLEWDRVPLDRWREWDDETEDFDTPQDYRTWLALRRP